MNKLLILTILSACLTINSFPQNWLTNFDEAKAKATNEHKNILLVFSGTDWCAPCIKLDKFIWHRITSYNVCYTKLLRTLDTQSNQPWERDHYSVYFDFGNHKSLTYLTDTEPPMDSVQFMLEKIWSVEGDLAMEDRITSYNVCYTKLLRHGRFCIGEIRY